MFSKGNQRPGYVDMEKAEATTFFSPLSLHLKEPNSFAEGKAGELEEWQHPTVGEDQVQEQPGGTQAGGTW